MEAYQGGPVTISVGVGVILLCVANIASNIYKTIQPRPFEECDMCCSFFNIIRDVKDILIMSWEECKLDRLKMNPRGTTNEAPICTMPIHATHLNCSVQFSFIFKSDWDSDP